MNKKTRKTTYHSPLRERQANETRIRILEAFHAVIKEEGHEAATFKAIASRAGVQESTVYRHFGNRAKLIKASFEFASAKDGRERWPETGETLLRTFEPTFEYMDANENLIRADLHTLEGRAFVELVREDRIGSALKIAEDVAPDLTAPERMALAVAITLLYSGPTWETLKDLWQIEPGKSGGIAKLAMEMMFEGARAREKTRSGLTQSQRKTTT